MKGIASKALAARNLRIVPRTDQEAEHVATSSPEQKAAAATNHATWKFQLLETVNADPKAKRYCVAVIAAYLHFCQRDTHIAYMAENELFARTAVDPKSLRIAKAKLVELGYLVELNKNAAGIMVYRLENPRLELVADHVVIVRETLREREAAKKEYERRRVARRGARNGSPRNTVGEPDLEGTRAPEVVPKSVEQSVESISSERGPSLRHDPWGVYEAALRPIGGRSSSSPAAWKLEVDA